MTTDTTQLEGRELDAAVAKVMGHKVHFNDSGQDVVMWHEGADAPAIYPMGYSIVDGVGYVVGSSIGRVFPVPHYSSDPAAMMDVIRHIRGQLFSTRLRFKRALQRIVTDRINDGALKPGELIAMGDVLMHMEPVDVARAALEALEVNDDD